MPFWQEKGRPPSLPHLLHHKKASNQWL